MFILTAIVLVLVIIIYLQVRTPAGVVALRSVPVPASCGTHPDANPVEIFDQDGTYPPKETLTQVISQRLNEQRLWHYV